MTVLSSSISAAPCHACHGRGWRIVTDDGTRPACIACAGSGLASSAREARGEPAPGGEPSSLSAAAAAAGHLPPARMPVPRAVPEAFSFPGGDDHG